MGDDDDDPPSNTIIQREGLKSLIFDPIERKNPTIPPTFVPLSLTTAIEETIRNHVFNPSIINTRSSGLVAISFFEFAKSFCKSIIEVKL